MSHLKSDIFTKVKKNEKVDNFKFTRKAISPIVREEKEKKLTLNKSAVDMLKSNITFS